MFFYHTRFPPVTDHGGLYLNLLYSQVQERVLVSDADETFGSFAAHAGAQTSVQLHHHQLIQAVGYVLG